MDLKTNASLPLPTEVVAQEVEDQEDTLQRRINNFPWWLPAIFLIAIFTAYAIATNKTYRESFQFIVVGLRITVVTTLTAYSISLVIGLITGLGRISKNVFFKNLATLYIEIIRGIPMLVLIFYIALVGVPFAIEGLNGFGVWLTSVGLGFIGTPLSKLGIQAVSMNLRAVVALSITYGAYTAEIFRAGIQSIGRGQMEAARSLGMSYGQAMRHVILPQAIRNVLPAIGNDFIAMLKDSSLVSVLAVRDITQVARLYSGRSFRFREAYTTLAVLYLTMTVLLSMAVQIIERRIRRDEK